MGCFSVGSNGVVKPKQLSWCPPVPGCVKLNVDGASSMDGSVAVAGGILRDDEGRWLGGFQHNIGPASPLQAELLAILSGLKLIMAMGLQHCTLETDSMEAWNSILKGGGEYGVGAEIRSLRAFCPHIKFAVAFRESNFCADWMAKNALGMSSGFVWLPNCPETMENLLSFDAKRGSTPRLCFIPHRM